MKENGRHQYVQKVSERLHYTIFTSFSTLYLFTFLGERQVSVYIYIYI